jgi:hypothetical protein
MPHTQKLVIGVALFLVGVAILVMIGQIFRMKRSVPVPETQSAPVPQPIQETPIVCSSEALLCPDGSIVKREGPECAFAPCPLPQAEIESQ